MSDRVKTLSLIETEKLRNFQENLKTLYEISEKYDTLSRELDEANEKICPSCENKALLKDKAKSAIGGKKQEDVLITPQNATLQNEQNVASVEKVIEQQSRKLAPTPDNVLTNEWYQVL